MADYIPITPNMSRVIKLRKEGLSSDSKDLDWRHNISYLLSLKSMDGAIKTNLNFSEGNTDVDVDNNVYLLMTDKLPDIDLNIALEGNTILNTVLGANTATNFLSTVNSLSDVLANKDWENSSGKTTSLKYLNPWVANVKVYDPNKSSSPISFNYTFKFNMGQYGLWDAKKEVFLPIVNLAIPTFIQQLGASSTRGPFPTEYNLIVNFITSLFSGDVRSDYVEGAKRVKENFLENWNSIKSSKNEDGSTDVSNLLSSVGSLFTDALEDVAKLVEMAVFDAYRGYTYEIKFGNFMTFRHMMITNSKFSFSNEVDQNGYPISGSINLSFTSMMPPAFSSSDTTDRLPLTFGG